MIPAPDQRWKIQKAKLLMRYPHLSEDDFYFDYGKKDVMITRLHAKLGISRDEFNKLLLTL